MFFFVAKFKQRFSLLVYQGYIVIFYVVEEEDNAKWINEKNHKND